MNEKEEMTVPVASDEESSKLTLQFLRDFAEENKGRMLYATMVIALDGENNLIISGAGNDFTPEDGMALLRAALATMLADRTITKARDDGPSVH